MLGQEETKFKDAFLQRQETEEAGLATSDSPGAHQEQAKAAILEAISSLRAELQTKRSKFADD